QFYSNAVLANLKAMRNLTTWKRRNFIMTKTETTGIKKVFNLKTVVLMLALALVTSCDRRADDTVIRDTDTTVSERDTKTVHDSDTMVDSDTVTLDRVTVVNVLAESDTSTSTTDTNTTDSSGRSYGSAYDQGPSSSSSEINSAVSGTGTVNDGSAP